jgi:hypothetical protein
MISHYLKVFKIVVRREREMRYVSEIPNLSAETFLPVLAPELLLTFVGPSGSPNCVYSIIVTEDSLAIPENRFIQDIFSLVLIVVVV